MRTIDRRTLLAGLATMSLAPPLFARGPAAYPAPTRELMVPVAGGNIYVRVSGDLAAAKPPIVMIHGGPGGTHGYFLDALPLADERAVILYDQLDSGKSDQPNDPKNWTVPRFVDEVDAVRRALDIARWHVLGHSWGGTVALEYGARRSPALAGLILASPLVSTRTWLTDARILVSELPAPVRAEIARCERLGPPEPPPTCDAATDAFYAAYNGRERPGEAMIAYQRARSGRGFNQSLYRAMWGDSEFVSTGTLRTYDGEPLLAKLDGPHSLFLCGQYDEARPATIGRFAARVPGAEFGVVPGAAHGIFGDRPEETVAMLRGWLARQDGVA